MQKDSQKGALIQVAWEINQIAYRYDAIIGGVAKTHRDKMVKDFVETLDGLFSFSADIINRDD